MSENNEQPDFKAKVKAALGVDFDVKDEWESGLNVTPVFPTFVWGKNHKPTKANVAKFLRMVAESLQNEVDRFDFRAVTMELENGKKVNT